MNNKLKKILGSCICLLSPFIGYVILTLYIGDSYPTPDTLNIAIGWFMLTASVFAGGILVRQ